VGIFGNTIAVGAYKNDVAYGGAEVDVGAVYIFLTSDGGDSWSQTQRLTIFVPYTSAFFGFDLSLHGNTLMVGASGNEIDPINGTEGGVFVFRTLDGGGEWSASQLVIPNQDSQANDRFGHSLSMYGSVAVVGSHLRDAGLWN
jgi:hypothetical protein